MILLLLTSILWVILLGVNLFPEIHDKTLNVTTSDIFKTGKINCALAAFSLCPIQFGKPAYPHLLYSLRTNTVRKKKSAKIENSMNIS